MAKNTIIETEVIYGKEYTDSVTGFVGKAVAITKWQHGCIRISLQAKATKDGAVPDAVWFDEESLKGVKSIVKKPGGPRPSPQMNPDPSR